MGIAAEGGIYYFFCLYEEDGCRGRANIGKGEEVFKMTRGR